MKTSFSFEKLRTWLNFPFSGRKRKQVRELCESVADLAYLAGRNDLYSGNWREDLNNIVDLGEEFHVLHRKSNWDEIEYIDTIHEFAEEKFYELGMKSIVKITLAKAEVIADIARYVGYCRYYSGDSMADVSQIIYLAEKFHLLHAHTDWYETDYIDVIDAFSEAECTRLQQEGYWQKE